MREKVALVWFDRDLRLGDNPALAKAIAEQHTVIPVFVWAPEEEAPWPPGAASRWWLHQSLRELQASLAKFGSKLIVRRGPTAEALTALCQESGAKTIFWNRRYEPSALARETDLSQRFRAHGISIQSCAGNILFEPGTVLNASGKPFQVFTAFWRACLAMPRPPAPTPIPARIQGPDNWPASLALSDLRLEPIVDWASGLRDAWRPGEAAASRQMNAFRKSAMSGYATERDRPDHRGTSRLSPYLHFGEISARYIWYAAGMDAETFRRQIAWREFSYHLLFHYPHTPHEPLRPEFRSFPWRMDANGFTAWSQGKTGYPLVDAGMRELWHTGWMHNRVRMLAASFLVKHLMIPWQEGAAWFWDTLVDADLANNTMGWQWSAGCGADAVPYFRIFNPTLQREKFDPDSVYIQHWIPELETGYPEPIVNHEFARRRALAALADQRALRLGTR